MSSVENIDDDLMTHEELLELQAYAQLQRENGTHQKSQREPKEFICQSNLLEQRAKELELDSIAGHELPFSQHLSHTPQVSVFPAIKDQVSDVNDDLSRELAFYRQALDTVINGWRILEKVEGIPVRREEDYFAEMLKSDEHMLKVRQNLLNEAQSLQKSHQAKQQRLLQKMGKQIQVQKLKERQEEKRKMLDKVELLKKRKRGQNSLDDNDDFDVSLLEQDDEKPNAKSPKSGGGKPGAPNAKRQKKNQKFGFGGKKRHAKSNDKKSTDDFQFSVKANKQLPKGFKGAARPTKKFKPQRPGKEKRQKQRK